MVGVVHKKNHQWKFGLGMSVQHQPALGKLDLSSQTDNMRVEEVTSIRGKGCVRLKSTCSHTQ